MDEPRQTTPGPAPPGGPSPALVSFLTTALLGTLGLLLALLLRPDWFGRDAGGPEPAARGGLNGAGPGRGGAPPPLRPDEVFAAVSPSVVHVTTSTLERRGIFDEFVVSGTASGLVWDAAGHVVTCDHIFDETTRAAKVTLSNGAQFDARLVEYDPVTDLAVIRIDAPPGALTPARVPPAGHELRVGEPAYAIACPFGLGHSLSSGVVSGLERRIRVPSGAELSGVIQTDAALHPGSSGGALADSLGRVIGMNAAIQRDGDVTTALGVGFAQPIQGVADVVPDMIDRGFTWFPRLGFTILGDDMAVMVLSEVVGANAPEAGAVVLEVDEGRRAAAAGMRQLDVSGRFGVNAQITLKDVIVSVGGAPIRSKQDLQEALADIPEGEPVTVVVARRDGEVELTL